MQKCVEERDEEQFAFAGASLIVEVASCRCWVAGRMERPAPHGVHPAAVRHLPTAYRYVRYFVA